MPDAHWGMGSIHRAYGGDLLTQASWVTADEAYGQNPTFRAWLADRRLPFVLATRNDDMVTSPDGHAARPRSSRRSPVLVIPKPSAAAGSGARSGAGAHGERVYDWTAVTLDTDGLPDGWGHWLLVRRQTTPPEGRTVRELAFYRCAGPATTPLTELIRVAGAWWSIEECFQAAKNEAGLDHYQVRSYRAWHAHITLAMLAPA